jgi:monofunctional biosynthetic peptidoglycan transglycosylase
MRTAGQAARRYRPVPLDSIAPSRVEAAVTAEDARFWTHGGVDWHEVRMALGYRRGGFEWGSARDRGDLWRALGELPQRKDAVRGASTITQQVAKNLYLSPSRNPLRKVKEAVTAYRMELVLPKRRILELYLNIAELGDGVWGVEAASRRYYRKSARRLTENQAAALAATLPFPRTSNPAYRPVRMRRRQQLILRRMRGERIELPPVPEVLVPQPGDSIIWTPGMDSLLDSLRAPIETLPSGLSAISYRLSGVPDGAHRSRPGTPDS